MTNKRRFALELLDRVLLHFKDCAHLCECEVCCIYNALYDEFSLPYAQEVDWVMQALERWAERTADEFEEMSGGFDTLEEPV